MHLHKDAALAAVPNKKASVTGTLVKIICKGKILQHCGSVSYAEHWF